MKKIFEIEWEFKEDKDEVTIKDISLAMNDYYGNGLELFKVKELNTEQIINYDDPKVLMKELNEATGKLAKMSTESTKADKYCECKEPTYSADIKDKRCYFCGKPIPSRAQVKPKEEMYPCEDCGVLRTKREGGTTFTVCDKCWNKRYKPKKRSKIEKLDWEYPTGFYRAVIDKINEIIDHL